MKNFRELSIRTIRANLARVGVEMTDEVFNSLTYSELKVISRKAQKAYRLYLEVDDIIYKPSAPKKPAEKAKG